MGDIYNTLIEICKGTLYSYIIVTFLCTIIKADLGFLFTSFMQDEKRLYGTVDSFSFAHKNITCQILISSIKDKKIPVCLFF